MDYMRVQIEIDFTVKRISIKPAENVKLDGIVVLPKIIDESGEKESEKIKMARLSALDKKFDGVNESSVSSDRSYGLDSFHKSLNHEETLDNISGPLVIIFMPNAGVYEVSCYNRDLLNFYTSKGVTVVLWNYRGFSYSTGKSNMDVSIIQISFLINIFFYF